MSNDFSLSTSAEHCRAFSTFSEPTDELFVKCEDMVAEEIAAIK